MSVFWSALLRPTDFSEKTMAFTPVKRRAVIADFDGGAITSDAGALLLGSH